MLLADLNQDVQARSVSRQVALILLHLEFQGSSTLTQSNRSATSMSIQHDPKWNQSVREDGVLATMSDTPLDDLLREMDGRGEPMVVVTFANDGEPCVAVAAPGDAEAREAARKAAVALTRFSEDRKDSAE